MPACLCRAFADFYSRAQGFNDVFGIHASTVHIDPGWSVAMAAAYDEATLRAAAGRARVKEVYKYQASMSVCVPILDQQESLVATKDSCLANQHTPGHCVSCLVRCVIEAL